MRVEIEEFNYLHNGRSFVGYLAWDAECRTPRPGVFAGTAGIAGNGRINRGAVPVFLVNHPPFRNGNRIQNL